MVVNAGNRTKIVQWINKQSEGWKNGKLMPVMDYTVHSAMIAIQGPKAAEVLAPFFNVERKAPLPDIRTMRYYHYSSEYFDGLISRTGYTGEDGFEIIVGEADAPQLWKRLEHAGVAPAGLGARDTLRLEAGMNLYGQDMDEGVTPWEAGLAWTVSLDEGRDFIGRKALEKQKAEGVDRVLVGLIMDDKGVLRHGQRVVTPIGDGEILSGGFSPTIGKSIAFARIPAGTEAGPLHADIRGKLVPVRVVKYPFVRDGKPSSAV
jgi:aminomethyltransferase